MRRLGIICCITLVSTAAAGDWLEWRGPLAAGYAPEKAVVTSWSPGGENVLWRNPSGGRTTPVLHDGRLYYIAPVGQDVMLQERVVCLDAATGRQLWEQRFNVFHTDIVENRVGWTSLAVDPQSGNIVAHATAGELLCWTRDGKLLWKRSLSEEFGRISGYGGRVMSPIVDENRVIVSFLNSSWGDQARGLHRYVAFDKDSGDILWWSSTTEAPLDTTYSVPVVTVIDGRRMLIAPAADGCVYGMLARTGEIVWKYKLSKRGLNVSPVVDGHYVYVAHSEENFTTTEMGAVVCLDASKSGDITDSGEVWRLNGLGVGYASPAVANGRLYVVDNSANLLAIDAKDGRVYWRHSVGRVGKGSPTVTADGVIYYGEQNGIFTILRDEGGRCVELDRDEFEGPGGVVDEIFGSPAVVGGRVYFMTRYNFFCLGSADAAVERVELPPAAREVETSGPPTGFLVVPAEITLRPGRKAEFRFFPYNAAGQLLPAAGVDVEPQATVAGVRGTADGRTFTAAADAAYSAGQVRFKWVGGKEVAARVRVMPELPISETFDAMPVGSVPPGWIGVGRRVEVIERNGGRVLRKIASKERPSPPFMRLMGDATPPISGGMTVQCDMMSELRDAGRRSFQPDMGLMNTRYDLILNGADKKRGKKNVLRLETWGAEPRLRKDVECDWQPDVWYTVKFEVRLENGKAICRGKFWPRDEAEPDGWMIELEDPCPNTEGTAGVYAYSTGTTPGSDGPQTYFDNFKVTGHE